MAKGNKAMRQAQCRKDGGGVMDKDSPPQKDYSNNNNVAKESKGQRPSAGADTFKSSVGKGADGVTITGGNANKRLDRPGRKSGGRVGGGSDKSPLSSAAGTTNATGRTGLDDGLAGD